MNAAVLSELARVKVLFQARAIKAVMGWPVEVQNDNCPVCTRGAVPYDIVPSFTIPEAECDTCGGSGQLSDIALQRAYLLSDGEDGTAQKLADELERRGLDF